MTPERNREISSMGGRTSQKNGSAHRWTGEEAREVGEKSGTARRKRREELEANAA